MINIAQNWETVKEELLATEREGMDALIHFLEDKTDWKTAPASTKFHLNVEGGLAQHSINTLRFARLINKELELDLPEDSITIAALLHDLCKVNFYVLGEEWDKEHKDKTNQWRKKAVWKTEDQIPLGHGEKSVILAVRFIELSVAEMVAIRWHMLAWDASTYSGRTMQGAMDQYPLLKTVAQGDQMAEFYEVTRKEEGQLQIEAEVKNDLPF